ncbi:MAG TPA: hypothetical protein VD966_10415 [Pyrinomonadaceae bacterium]|nr:hypothetical protein [Pyrinomonadaceae bacterium]
MSTTTLPAVMVHRSWRSWLSFMLLAAAFAYIWVLPLIRPRGSYLWGHYQLRDIYAGIPVGVAMLCAVIIMAAPARYRRALALRLVVLSFTVVALIFAIDAGYTLGYLEAWRVNPSFDLGGLNRKYNLHDAELGFIRKPEFVWSKPRDKDTGRPVYFRTDENGFRNPLGLRQADIAFIGDSFTEAASIAEEETYAQLIGAGSGLRVVNLGMGAYGPQQELIVLKRYGLKYNPRVVVWQIFEGNDLGNAQSFAKYKENPKREYKSLIERYISSSLITEFLTPTLPPGPEASTVPAKFRFTDGEVRPIYVKYPYGELPAKKPLGFEETKRVVEEGYRLCQSRGIQLVVVFVPTMIRVMAPYVTFDRAADHDKFLPGDVTQDPQDFGSQLGEFCKQIGCPYLDTYEALRERAKVNNRQIYIPNDEHLDVEGHRVVAEEVLKWMRSQPTLNLAQK